MEKIGRRVGSSLVIQQYRRAYWKSLGPFHISDIPQVLIPQTDPSLPDLQADPCTSFESYLKNRHQTSMTSTYLIQADGLFNPLFALARSQVNPHHWEAHEVVVKV